jgi:hypothetical protein
VILDEAAQQLCAELVEVETVAEDVLTEFECLLLTFPMQPVFSIFILFAALLSASARSHSAIIKS